MPESATKRWSRRAVSIPSVLAATAVAVVGAPVLAPAAAVADLARGRTELPTLRVYGFLTQYLCNDSLEVLLAPLLWVRARFGTGLGSVASTARHQRLQDWSARVMADRADRLLGLPVRMAAEDRAQLQPGPVIVLCRHVSLFDASLPGLIYEPLGYRVRGVIMAELLADPGFDLIYGRTGSVFIPRDDGPAAVGAVRQMADGADERTALVIFPEGRLFRTGVRDRALTRLADRDPERAARLGSLTRVLPPRPGGFLALLDAAPTADVVLLDHRGLDDLDSLGRLLGRVPLRRPVTVTARRFERATIPTDRDERVRWLDQRWSELDRCLADDLEQDADGPVPRLVE